MDYKKMWKEMKLTYEDRVEKIESNGGKGNIAWINARKFVVVMEHFELKEGYGKKKIPRCPACGRTGLEIANCSCPVSVEMI